MQYKLYSVKCNKNYFARIFRYPDIVPYELLGLPLHWHRDYELLYVDKGTLTLQKLDETIILNPGDLYFINSEEVHTYNTPNRDEASFFSIVLSIRTLQPFFDNPTEALNFKINSQHTKEKIVESIKRLKSSKNFFEPLEVLKVKAVINNITYYLLRDCRDDSLNFYRGGADSEDFLCAKSAVHYMEENYAKNITLDEISRYVGMTPSHFSKYFKEKVNRTFTQYLRKIRLEHAVNDLTINHTSVKNAALNNGFPNTNAFINSCKNEFGKTPMELKLFNEGD